MVRTPKREPGLPINIHGIEGFFINARRNGRYGVPVTSMNTDSVFHEHASCMIQAVLNGDGKADSLYEYWDDKVYTKPLRDIGINKDHIMLARVRQPELQNIHAYGPGKRSVMLALVVALVVEERGNVRAVKQLLAEYKIDRQFDELIKEAKRNAEEPLEGLGRETFRASIGQVGEVTWSKSKNSCGFKGWENDWNSGFADSFPTSTCPDNRCHSKYGVDVVLVGGGDIPVVPVLWLAKNSVFQDSASWCLQVACGSTKKADALFEYSNDRALMARCRSQGISEDEIFLAKLKCEWIPGASELQAIGMSGKRSVMVSFVFALILHRRISLEDFVKELTGCDPRLSAPAYDFFSLADEESRKLNGDVPSPVAAFLPMPGNYSLPVTENYSLPATGNFSLPATGNFSLPATGNFSLPMPGNYSLPVTENFSLPATGNFSLPETTNDIPLLAPDAGSDKGHGHWADRTWTDYQANGEVKNVDDEMEDSWGQWEGADPAGSTGSASTTASKNVPATLLTNSKRSARNERGRRSKIVRLTSPEPDERLKSEEDPPVKLAGRLKSEENIPPEENMPPVKLEKPPPDNKKRPMPAEKSAPKHPEKKRIEISPEEKCKDPPPQEKHTNSPAEEKRKDSPVKEEPKAPPPCEKRQDAPIEGKEFKNLSLQEVISKLQVEEDLEPDEAEKKALQRKRRRLRFEKNGAAESSPIGASPNSCVDRKVPSRPYLAVSGKLPKVRPLSQLRVVLANIREEMNDEKDGPTKEWAKIAEEFRSIRQELTVQQLQNDRFAREVYELNAELALRHDDLPHFEQTAALLSQLFVDSSDGPVSCSEVAGLWSARIFILYLRRISRNSGSPYLLNQVLGERYAEGLICKFDDERVAAAVAFQKAVSSGKFMTALSFVNDASDAPKASPGFKRLLIRMHLRVRLEVLLRMSRSHQGPVKMESIGRRLELADDEATHSWFMETFGEDVFGSASYASALDAKRMAQMVEGRIRSEEDEWRRQRTEHVEGFIRFDN